MAFGITDEGFNPKDLETIKTEIENSLKADIDPGINTSATSVLGQLIGVFAGSVSELWDVSNAIYSAWDPDQASGASLDAIAALSGTIRRAATFSTVTATVNLDNGTTLPAGSQANVAGDTSAVFETLAAVTNSTGSTDDFSVEMQATQTGPVVANAGTLTQITTPVAGWNTVTNALAADPGNDEETDSELRIRREAELRAQGNASVEAIKADVTAVEDVTDVLVVENVSLVTDGDGIPGKAFETIVLGGTDANVASAIFESKAAGIQAYGTTTEVVTDSMGFSHNIGLTRPTQINMLANIATTIDSAEFPADGEQQIQDAMEARGDELLGIGDDVIITKYYSAVNSVSGVADVTSLQIYDDSSLGAESLSEPTFATVTKWSEVGDWDLTAGTYAEYTHSSGTGTLTQTSANLATSLTASRWYKFTYDIVGFTGAAVTAQIDTGIARYAVNLPISNGTQTAYVFTNEAPGDFNIVVTSTAASTFQLDVVSLKLVAETSGNYTVSLRELADIDSVRVGVVTS